MNKESVLATAKGTEKETFYSTHWEKILKV